MLPRDGGTGGTLVSTNVEHPQVDIGSITAQTVSHCQPIFSLFAGISLVLTDCGPVKLIYTHAAHAKPTSYLLCSGTVPNSMILVATQRAASSRKLRVYSIVKFRPKQFTLCFLDDSHEMHVFSNLHLHLRIRCEFWINIIL